MACLPQHDSKKTFATISARSGHSRNSGIRCVSFVTQWAPPALHLARQHNRERGQHQHDADHRKGVAGSHHQGLPTWACWISLRAGHEPIRELYGLGFAVTASRLFAPSSAFYLGLRTRQPAYRRVSLLGTCLILDFLSCGTSATRWSLAAAESQAGRGRIISQRFETFGRAARTLRIAAKPEVFDLEQSVSRRSATRSNQRTSREGQSAPRRRRTG